MDCRALYLHVPFCERKCPYCDFYSVAADEARMDAYTAAVLRALGSEPFGVRALDTVYFGGGTPSILGGRRLAAMLDAVFRRFEVAPDAEITVECNPHSALPQTLRELRAAGCNRVSIGMQSADDRQLELLGRLHTSAGTAAAADAARKSGIENISLDLMLATPGQTRAQVDAAVRLCERAGAGHVSAYLLKVEEGTPFAARGVGRDCPDEDGQAALYLHAAGALEAAGYRQYEISNFARPGREARHNLKYWNCEGYLGVGPSAHSFVDGRRRYFPRDLDGFLKAGTAWALLCDDGPGGDLEEYLMLRLRLREGARREDLLAREPSFDWAGFCEKARPMISGGLVCRDGGRLWLTREGFLLSNAVIAALLEAL